MEVGGLPPALSHGGGAAAPQCAKRGGLRSPGAPRRGRGGPGLLLGGTPHISPPIHTPPHPPPSPRSEGRAGFGGAEPAREALQPAGVPTGGSIPAGTGLPLPIPLFSPRSAPRLGWKQQPSLGRVSSQVGLRRNPPVAPPRQKNPFLLLQLLGLICY